MANKTQMRVQQLTGSLVDLAYSGSQSSAGAADTLAALDLGGVLGEFAGAIGRIQGKTSDFTDQAEGVFNYTGADFNLDTDGNVNIDGATGINIGTAADVAIDIDAAGLDIDASAGITLTSSEAAADAIVLDASNAVGGIDMNVEGSTVVSVDSNSVDLAQQLVISAGGMDVSGLTTLRGDLQVLGTTTTVSSSNTEFADGLIGLNYSGSQTGPDRDIGLIMGRDSGNKAFFWDNSFSMFMLGETSNDPLDAAVALSAGTDLGLGNIQMFGDGSGWSQVQASGSNVVFRFPSNASQLEVAGNLIVSGTAINSDADDAKTLWGVNATTTITIGGGGLIDLAGDLKVTGNEIQDSGGASTIAFDGSQNVTVAGMLDLTTGIVRDATDNQMIEFNAGNLILSASGGDLVMTRNDGEDSLNINLPQDTIFVLNDGNTKDELQFQIDGGDTLFHVNATGIQMQGGTAAPACEIGWSTGHDGVEAAFSWLVDVNNSSGRGYSGLTGSLFFASGSGDGAPYIKIQADDVTGSAGTSMEGGLFLSDRGFNLMTETYSWSRGVLFASGSSDYDDFAAEFGANATILSALAAGAGGSATRDDTVIAAQVVAGGTTTLGSDCSAVPESSADERVQVFVNGQLMMSGSSNDYTLTAYGASTNALFKFDIEVDDVVTVLAK